MFETDVSFKTLANEKSQTEKSLLKRENCFEKYTKYDAAMVVTHLERYFKYSMCYSVLKPPAIQTTLKIKLQSYWIFLKCI